MDCTHERIKSVNCALFCLDCGAKLPAGFRPGKHTPEAEQPAKAQETAKKSTRKKVTK